MASTKLAERFKALGEPSRLRILKLLPPSDEDCSDVYNVTELAAELKLSQPMISHHLGVLRQAGLVKNRKMCRDVYYWINKPALDELLQALRDFTHDA